VTHPRFIKLTDYRGELWLEASQIELIRRAVKYTTVHTLSGRRIDVTETPEQIMEMIGPSLALTEVYKKALDLRPPNL
jgi:uncharacterized protein YlzI (FlbEa/FlbD family)